MWHQQLLCGIYKCHVAYTTAMWHLQLPRFIYNCHVTTCRRKQEMEKFWKAQQTAYIRLRWRDLLLRSHAECFPRHTSHDAIYTIFWKRLTNGAVRLNNNCELTPYVNFTSKFPACCKLSMNHQEWNRFSIENILLIDSTQSTLRRLVAWNIS